MIKILSIILVVLAIASASKQYEYGYFPIAQIIHVGLMILHTIGLFRRNSQLMTIGFYVCWFEALLRILFLLLAAICNYTTVLTKKYEWENGTVWSNIFSDLSEFLAHFSTTPVCS